RLGRAVGEGRQGREGDPELAGMILTLQEAASFLKVHENTVRNLVKRGVLPGAKVGYRWRFLQHDLEAWLQRGYSVAAQKRPSADLRENDQWHSLIETGPITLSSRVRVENQLDDLLKPKTGRRRRSITTDSRQKSGRPSVSS